MAHNNYPGKEPLRQQPQPASSSTSTTPRLATPSDISDFDFNPYDPDFYAAELRGRESLVSMNSQASSSERVPTIRDPDPPTKAGPGNDSGHITSPSSSWPSSISYPGAAKYVPVTNQGQPPPRTKSHKAGRMASLRASLRRSAVDSIDEEDEIDMSLLSSAAPIARGQRYEAIAEEEPSMTASAFGGLSPIGPMDLQQAEFVARVQEEEAKGNLTGGLGQGFRPDYRVKDSDLLASPTTPRRNLSVSLGGSFMRRKSSRLLDRAATIRHMGQDEANRRGEVVEVILEQPPPAEADLSTVEGSSLNEARRSTFQPLQKTETFYPQPNWKPFSMRLPYMVMLVVLSMALAAMQEILFRRFRTIPLVKFQSPDQVNPGLYFAVKFVPTLAAVVYGVLWQFVDFEVRRLEAYYQLSKPEGALAAESINIDYVTSFNLFRPYHALKRRHFAVAVSSIATMLAISLVPTFAAASVVLEPGRNQRRLHPDSDKELHFSNVWSRLLTSTLAVCAVLGLLLAYLLQRRRSGLLSDVRGIAGLASMAVVSHILMDFKDMDTAMHKDIHHKLKMHRYVLRNSSLAPDDENPVSTQDRDKYAESTASENPHPLMLRPAGMFPYLVGLLAFTGFVPVFLFSAADVVADTVPWIITLLAVLLKMIWNGFDTSVRMMEPYYILSKRHAPPKTLALDYTALPFGYMPLRALFNGHMLVVAVGFGSVMAEFLTILVTGLSSVDGQEFLRAYNPKINSGQETVMSFFVSFALVLFILLYMITVAGVVFLRRRHPFLPRQPNTIASVLAFMHQSKMLWDFVGTEKLDNSEMVRRLQHADKRYGLGWFRGRDGQTHCGVDQEELISDYKHGIDFSQGIKPWSSQWDVL